MLNVQHHLFLPRSFEPYHFQANLVLWDGPFKFESCCVIILESIYVYVALVN